MSLSYRKARTAPAPALRDAAYRAKAATRGTAYRVAGTGRAFQPGAAETNGTAEIAGYARPTQPETVGTSAVRAGAAFETADDGSADASTTTNRIRHDNVVELFPGASEAPPGPARGGWWSRFRYAEAGMATAEYAIATLAAVGFAGLLVVILRSDEVRGFLMTIIEQALTLG